MTTKTLIDSLRGEDIKTDHGGLNAGDIMVLILDIVLLVYTGWRSYDFLTTSVPSGMELIAMVGLWGLDIGAVLWSVVWMFGSSTKYQDAVAMGFFIFDLLGVILTSTADALMYGGASHNEVLSKTIGSIAVVAVPLVVVLNVVAGFIYHMTSPQTAERRARRKADHAHNVEMAESDELSRQVLRLEAETLARADILEKAKLLAAIRMEQEGLENELNTVLKNRVLKTGVRALEQPAAPAAPTASPDQMRARIAALKTAHTPAGVMTVRIPHVYALADLLAYMNVTADELVTLFSQINATPDVTYQKFMQVSLLPADMTVENFRTVYAEVMEPPVPVGVTVSLTPPAPVGFGGNGHKPNFP